MAILRRILVATDFSPTASRAVDAAATLAGEIHAEVLLVHVYAAPIVVFADAVMPVSPGDLGRMMERLEGQLEEARKQVSAHGISTVETVLVEGDPWRRIVETARERDCDLIVLGSHGHSRVVRFLLGSVAERVVRASDRPVLVIPNHEHG